MFAPMRRSDRELSEESARQLLEKCLYGVLATVTPDGQPYGVPISYGYDGHRIVVHCAKGVGQKLENIAAEPRVSFTVVDNVETLPGKFSTTYESAIVVGCARVLEGREEKKAALRLLIDKYSADFQERGAKYIEGAVDKTTVLELSIDQITGKARR